mmetsp:Transcript_13930/g.26003  ORF Transcript_13930/g.26003 Transcript_13930/m.26003 type:complete len:347 (-) Transcript_13930:1649-2689(-)
MAIPPVSRAGPAVAALPRRQHLVHRLRAARTSGATSALKGAAADLADFPQFARRVCCFSPYGPTVIEFAGPHAAESARSALCSGCAPSAPAHHHRSRHEFSAIPPQPARASPGLKPQHADRQLRAGSLRGRVVGQRCQAQVDSRRCRCRGDDELRGCGQSRQRGQRALCRPGRQRTDGTGRRCRPQHRCAARYRPQSGTRCVTPISPPGPCASGSAQHPGTCTRPGSSARAGSSHGPQGRRGPGARRELACPRAHTDPTKRGPGACGRHRGRAGSRTGSRGRRCPQPKPAGRHHRQPVQHPGGLAAQIRRPAAAGARSHRELVQRPQADCQQPRLGDLAQPEACCR